MSRSSNLYAEKIFAEHPLALWSLDDSTEYVSLISELDRDISLWSKTNVQRAVLTNEFLEQPIASSLTGEFAGNVTAFDNASFTLVSNEILNSNALNEQMANFTIGAHFYFKSQFIEDFEFGYQYFDEDSQEDVVVARLFKIPAAQVWIFASDTFSLPPKNVNLKIYLRVNYFDQSATPESYLGYINGLTVGQWAEEYHSRSLGTEVGNFPTNIALDATKAVEALPYGLGVENGYHLVDNNRFLAKKSGVPLVFGATGATSLQSNNGGPAIILPALGFLNELGRYRDYTLEFWLRVDSNTSEPKRIVGPISSDDGIYVEGPFISVKVGDQVSSHFVAEWFRPMLVDLTMSENFVRLLINGEQVLLFEIDRGRIPLPSKFNAEGKDQDWLGFYSYDDVFPMQIDSVAIYSYQVPEIVAKRRWVFGQGVEYPETLNSAYNSSSFVVDYSFANYAKNYVYPDIGRWQQGTSDNSLIENNFVSAPAYSLPEIKISDKSIEELTNDLSANESRPFLTFKPNEDWVSTESCMTFPNLNFLTEEVQAFYGLFASKYIESGTQELMKIENIFSEDYLLIRLNNNKIEYVFKYGEIEEVLYDSWYPENEPFLAGINIKKFASYFGKRTGAFFGNLNQLSLFVGGNKNLVNTFEGKIYRVGFSNKRNFSKIANYFNFLGTPIPYENVFSLYTQEIVYNGGDFFFGNESVFYVNRVDGGDPSARPAPDPFEHIASYTIVPTNYLGKVYLDIATDSYWEDYIPLSYLSQKVDNGTGKLVPTFDFVQFNIGYPSLAKFIEGKYDTSKSDLKTYIVFREITTGSNVLPARISNLEKLSKSNVVEPGANWRKTRYEVIDNTIIYPPKNVDFRKLVISIQVEIQNKSIQRKPIKLKNMAFASQALSSGVPKFVGSKFGKRLFPFTRTGVYFDYKKRNPFVIYKGSTPYLYMTKNSGIALRGDADNPKSFLERGLSIPINTELSNSFSVIAAQAFVRYPEDVFPVQPVPIFEIQSKNTYIKIFVQATTPDRKRGKIFAIDALAGGPANGIAFYINGKLVRDPAIFVGEWNILGISFSNRLIFDNFVGAFRILGPAIFNNVSYYLASGALEFLRGGLRPWFRVKFFAGAILNWDFWKPFSWRNVLVTLTSTFFGADPEDIYKIYTGTNKIEIGDDREFKFGDYQYTAYKDVAWSSEVVKPI